MFNLQRQFQILRNRSRNGFCKGLAELLGLAHPNSNYGPYTRFTEMAGETPSTCPDGVTTRTYQVVVAATCEMGIAKDKKIPWDLPSDLKFFKELTTKTSDPQKKNAVLMGRRTWESLPIKHRPLPNRLNILLTRSGNSNVKTTENVVMCRNLFSALQLLAEDPYRVNIERVFVIGGGQVLREALNGPMCEAIHITWIETSIECDTFIPAIDLSRFRLWHTSLPLVENNILFSFATYVRVRKCDRSSSSNEVEVTEFSFLPEMILQRGRRA